jgi:hypothetical protein
VTFYCGFQPAFRLPVNVHRRKTCLTLTGVLMERVKMPLADHERQMRKATGRQRTAAWKHCSGRSSTRLDIGSAASLLSGPAMLTSGNGRCGNAYSNLDAPSL